MSRSVVLALVSVFLLSSCMENNTLSVNEVGGKAFSFKIPITAISSWEDKILVAMDHGTIGVFDTDDETVDQELYNLNCGTIYYMEVVGDYLYYTVQDGGIRRMDLTRPDLPHPVFSIGGDKDTYFSAYDLIIDSRKQTLSAATSNGVYKWDLEHPEKKGEPILGGPDRGPHRYYNILEENDSTLIVGGKGEGEGVFRIVGSRVDKISQKVTLAVHDGFVLLIENNVTKIAQGYDRQEIVATFKRSPLNFVVDGRNIYAISENAIESVDSSRVITTIDLSEEHPIRELNPSRRAIGLVHGRFLYAAPGGANLYKIPLPYDKDSQRVVSLCEKDGVSFYALTADKDLFVVELSDKDGNRSVATPTYVRSLASKSEQASLIGVDGDGRLIAQVGKAIARIDGRNPLDTLHTLHGGGASSEITDNLFVGTTLYQARTDSIRRYDFSDSPNPTPYSFCHRENDGLMLKPNVNDYYPTHMAFVKPSHLVFSTLHDGVYAVDVSRKDYRFDCLVSPHANLAAKDISAVESVAFILTADSLYRFDRLKMIPDKAWGLDCLMKKPLTDRAGSQPFGERVTSYFNRIVALSPKKLALFTDRYDFLCGTYCFELDEQEKRWVLQETNNESNSIHDALFLKERDLLVLGGSMGVYFADNDETVPIGRPSFVDTIRARLYPLFWLAVVAAAVLLIAFAFLVFILLARWRDRIKNMREAVKMEERLNALAARQPLSFDECDAALEEGRDIENDFKTHLHAQEQRLADNMKRFETRKQEIRLKARVDALAERRPRTIGECDAAILEEEAIEREFRPYLQNYASRLTEILSYIKTRKEAIMDEEKRGRFTEACNALRKWSIGDFKSLYISKLANEIIDLSEGDPEVLDRRVSIFRQNPDQLRILDEIGVIIEKVVTEYKSFAPGTQRSVIEEWRKDPLAEYIEKVADFFRFFLDEEKERSEWGLIFKSLRGVSQYKQVFMFLPLCDDRNVGESFLTLNFTTRKSEWKNGTNDPIHSLKNLTGPEHHGILSLIARAGLRRLTNGG